MLLASSGSSSELLMYLHRETLTIPEANLAFDEALVEVADRMEIETGFEDPPAGESITQNEVLRLWEFESPCVVLGRASKWNEEVHWDACQRDGVSVLRRASGGATILAGPGCLMYSVLVSYQHRPAWRSLDVAHREVMLRIRDAVQSASDCFGLHLQINTEGTCDLTIEGRKFSGNALRCKRNWMIYHGTIMYSMHLDSLSCYLKEPPRQPEYRKRRPHKSFVRNLLDHSNSISPAGFRIELEKQLSIAWSATAPWCGFAWRSEVAQETNRLLETRYLNQMWHLDR